MVRIVNLSIIIITLLAFGCQPETPQELLTVPQSGVILFKDKTTSGTQGSEVSRKWRTETRSLLLEKLRNPGDKVFVSYIFSRTNSAANRIEFEFVPPNVNMNGLTEIQEKQLKIGLRKRVKQYKSEFIDSVLTVVFDIEPSLSGTNVIGAIPYMQNISSENPEMEFDVLFMSDMKEHSEFRKMTFNSGDLSSIENANKAAQSDITKIQKRYSLQSDCLNKCKGIRVAFPANRLDGDPAFDYLPAYWRTVFKAFGVNNVRFS